MIHESLVSAQGRKLLPLLTTLLFSSSLTPAVLFAQETGSSGKSPTKNLSVITQDSARKQTRGKTPSPSNPILRSIKDMPGLPRVLLIGDSISMGYTAGVRERLKGQANVHRIPANGGPTTRGLSSIDRWLGDETWDVIHFNWGIHDLRQMSDGKRQVEPEAYEANLRRLVERLQKTGARLIWASITPIPKGKLNPDRTFGDETEYNAIAARVMHDFKIPINDLHTYVSPRFSELQRPNDLHYMPEGSEYLAERVSREIADRLPTSDGPSPPK